jgi:hypothetical protein
MDKLFVCEARLWQGGEADLAWHNDLGFWMFGSLGIEKDATSNDLVKKKLFGPALAFIFGRSGVFIQRWGRRCCHAGQGEGGTKLLIRSLNRG